MAPARDADGDLVLLLVDDATGKGYVGDQGRAGGATRASRARRVRRDLEPRRRVTRSSRQPPCSASTSSCRTYTVPVGGTKAIRPEGLETALELAPTLRYSAATDTFMRIEDGHGLP